MPGTRKGALFAALAVAFAAPAATAAAPAAPTTTAAAAAVGKCRHGKIARIGGKRTCLAAGRRCQRRYQRQYKRNGYTCKRRTSGVYRLKKIRQAF
jgi:hypothetical protein